MRIVAESEFAERMAEVLADVPDDCMCVVGPGRSGAVAAVYASHILRIPFIPYGQAIPNGWRVLIVDTAVESGATIRKAARKYDYANPFVCYAFAEPPRVAFWYEAPKPQKYRHERDWHDRAI